MVLSFDKIRLTCVLRNNHEIYIKVLNRRFYVWKNMLNSPRVPKIPNERGRSERWEVKEGMEWRGRRGGGEGMTRDWKGNVPTRSFLQFKHRLQAIYAINSDHWSSSSAQTFCGVSKPCVQRGKVTAMHHFLLWLDGTLPVVCCQVYTPAGRSPLYGLCIYGHQTKRGDLRRSASGCLWMRDNDYVRCF